MSNDQVKGRLSLLQEKVRESLSSLRQILLRTKELREAIEALEQKGIDREVVDSLRKIHDGLMNDIDLHIDKFSNLVDEYQELIQDTV